MQNNHCNEDTTFLPPDVCPYCDYIVECASPIPGHKGAKPRPGDITACLNCASLLLFDENLKLRAPRQGEVQMTPELHRLQGAIRSIDRSNLPSQQKK